MGAEGIKIMTSGQFRGGAEMARNECIKHIKEEIPCTHPAPMHHALAEAFNYFGGKIGVKSLIQKVRGFTVNVISFSKHRAASKCPGKGGDRPLLWRLP